MIPPFAGRWDGRPPAEDRGGRGMPCFQGFVLEPEERADAGWVGVGQPEWLSLPSGHVILRWRGRGSGLDRLIRSGQQVAIAKLPLTQVQEGRHRVLVGCRGFSAWWATSAANAVVTPPMTATWVISMGSIRVVRPR